MEPPFLAAVDLGGTKITASLANREKILAKVYQPAQLEGDNKTIPQQVDLLISYLCDLKGISKDDINAVGIGSCGPFKKKEGHITLVAPNLCGGLTMEREVIPNDWTEIPLETVLSQVFHKLVIDNDAIVAAMAERLFGAGKGEDDLVYVTWSTGIGSGAYVNGRLIKGKNGNAPHLGHIYLVEDGPLCGCGNFGDMEALVSGVAIARDYGGTTEEVFLAYRRGDTRAKEIIEGAAKYFARGLASINAILDTKVFVIGGSVFMNNIDILTPLIENEFYKSFPALSDGVKIRRSALDTYLGDMAALSLVMPDDWIKVWQDEKPWEHAPEKIILEKW
ncbi:MAG: ROK family protein [Methanosarcinales archaeon]|nr:ROK family protein [Methanosarcinales archaeon]